MHEATCKLSLSTCKNILCVTVPSISDTKNHFTVIGKRNWKHVEQSFADVVISEASFSNAATLYLHLPSSCPCWHTWPALIPVPGQNILRDFLHGGEGREV